MTTPEHPELDREAKSRIDGIAGNFGSRWASPDEVGWSFEESAFHEFCAALLSAPKGTVPDGVWEALQRLVENGLMAGPASAEDARTVARYRDRSALLATPARADAPIGEDRRKLELLASAIAAAAQKAGIYNGEAPLAGPHLLQLLDDLASGPFTPIAAPAGQPAAPVFRNGQWEGRPLSEFPELQEAVRRGLADGTLEVQGSVGQPATSSEAAPAPVVPDGYKLVPIKSTVEMDKAGQRALPLGCREIDAECCWDAMLLAAPSAAAPAGQPQAVEVRKENGNG